MTQPFEIEAERVARGLLGGPVRRSERIPVGVMTFKYRVELEEGGRYVVRFYPPSRARVVEYEPDLIRRLAGEGLPVANVVGDSRSGPPASLAYMVYELLEGTPLSERLDAMTRSSRDRLAGQLVALMHGLGRLRFAGAGEPVSAWRASSSSWPAFVSQSFFEGLRSLSDHALAEPEVLDRLERIGGRLGELVAPAARSLAWVDCSPENILVTGRDELAGVVDLESVLVGDPLVPLGSFHARFGNDAFFQTLARAWPETPDEATWRRIHLLSILRVLRVAKHAHRPLPTGHPRAPLAEVFPGLREAAARLDPAPSSEADRRAR